MGLTKSLKGQTLNSWKMCTQSKTTFICWFLVVVLDYMPLQCYIFSLYYRWSGKCSWQVILAHISTHLYPKHLSDHILGRSSGFQPHSCPIMFLLGESDPTLRHIQSFFMSAVEAEDHGLDLKPGFYVAKIRKSAKTTLMKVTDQIMPNVHGQNLQTRQRRLL